MKKFLIYSIECTFLFLFLPIILSKTPLISGIAGLLSIIINVFLLTLFALSFGKRKGFSILLPFVTITIAGIAGWILGYTILRVGFTSGVYAVVSIVGEILGLMFRKKKND